MVKQQLRTGDVLNSSILGLYQTLPREHFIPRPYKQFAYSDYRIPLGHGQKMLTPLEEATILQALNLKGTESVLEIGTGSGYFTALLSQCAQHVVSVDYFPELTKHAAINLGRFHIDNVSLYTGDAHRGWMDNAPYDVIVVTGAIPRVDDIFKPQLMKHGKLFAIVGSPPAMHGVLFTLDDHDNWIQQILFDTYVDPLISHNETSKFTF